jgi:hypothetical protein
VVTSARGPYVGIYPYETPYMSTQEFLDTPTSISINDLIPDGTTAQQMAALATAIRRASSWADDIVNQVLACTPNTERGEYRIDRQGYVRLPTSNKPILEVTNVSVGTRPSSMSAMTTLADVVVNKYTVKIPVLGSAVPTTVTGLGGFQRGSRVIVDLSYLSGFPLTSTTGATTAGATTLNTVGALGVYPGSSLIIRDGANTESVTVASTYASGTSLPLVSGCQYAHAAGVTVDSLPSRVKEAVALYTTALLQVRGNDAIILDAMETPTALSTQYGASGQNVAMAKQMLESLMRVW